MIQKNDDGKQRDRGDELRLLADIHKKDGRAKSVDELGLESRRRAIAYGRARGNA